jgi:hypothetical protein
MVFKISTICTGRLWLSFARKAGAIELGHYVFLLSARFSDYSEKEVLITR